MPIFAELDIQSLKEVISIKFNIRILLSDFERQLSRPFHIGEVFQFVVLVMNYLIEFALPDEVRSVKFLEGFAGRKVGI